MHFTGSYFQSMTTGRPGLGIALFLCIAAAWPAMAAVPAAAPQGSAFCSVLDPLSAHPTDHCAEGLADDRQGGDEDEALRKKLSDLEVQGKADDAVKLVDEEIARRPLSPSLYYFRGRLLQGQDKQSAAIAEFDRALSLSPDMPAALLQRGWAYGRLNQFDKATADNDRVLAMMPDLEPALINKALLLIATGKRDDGMKLFDTLVAQSQRPGELHVIRARLMLSAHDSEQALRDLAQATTLVPDNPDSYVLRASILMGRNQHADALSDINKALELGSPEPDLLLWRGVVRQRMGDQAGADADFRAYSEKNPLRAADVLRFMRAHPAPDTGALQLAQMALNESILRQDFAGAEKAADDLLQLDPADTKPFGVKAIAAYQRRNCDDALLFLGKAGSSVADSLDGLGLHAACLTLLGKPEEAIAYSTRMVAMAPGNAAVLRLHIGALLAAGRFAETLGALDTLAALGGTQPDDEGVRIAALNYTRRRDEAARLATSYISRYGSEDRTVGSVVPELVFSLQRDSTWPLADGLLAVFKPMPEQRDDMDYLAARSQMHAGETARALATLMGTRDANAANRAMSDGAFRPLWDTAPFMAAFDPALQPRRSFEKLYQQHKAAPANMTDTVDMLDSLADLGCRPQALAGVLKLIASAPRYEQWSTFAARPYMLAASILADEGDNEGAARQYDAGLAAVEPMISAELLLDYAVLMTLGGQPAKAIILTDLAMKRAMTPFGLVIAHAARAFAFHELGDKAGLDASIAYLDAHWTDNAGAVIEPLGMLKSYDHAVDMIEDAAGDPERGRHVLSYLNWVENVPARSPLEQRIMAFRAKLTADPRVLKAVARIGRMVRVPYQATCPLTDAELAAHPFVFPFETPAADQASPISPGQ